MLKRHKLWTALAGVVLLVPMLLAACGPSSSTTASANTNAQPKKGGSVTDALFEEPDTLLPFLTSETFAVMVDQAIWAPLWYGDPNGQLHAGIATEVPSTQNGGISADGKTYTIHLKSGLKWSDGSPLTADDLAFSLQLYSNPAFANTFGFPLTSDPAGVASVTEPDSSTVVLKLKQPNVTIDALLADGAGSVIPKKVFGSMNPADIAKSKENFQPTVTSGPFMVKSRVSGSSITLVRNPNYYQPGLPYLDQVTFKIISDQATILTALQSHQVDSAWFLSVNSLNSYKAIQGYTTYIDKNPAGWEAAYFNLKNPILADPVVRKALTMSFDPNQLITQVWHGAAKPTCDDSAGTFAHEPSLYPCYKYDPTAAAQALQNDGWKVGAGGYRYKNGQELALTYSTTSNNTTRAQVEQLAQAAWKKIGVKITIKNYPAQQFFAAGGAGILSSGKFDIGEFAETLGYDPDEHTLWMCDQTPAKGGSNYTSYCNPTVDQAERTQMSNPDQTVRKQQFHIIHTQLLKDNPLMYYYSAANIAVASNNLHNYDPSPLGPTETWNIWDWWLS